MQACKGFRTPLAFTDVPLCLSTEPELTYSCKVGRLSGRRLAESTYKDTPSPPPNPPPPPPTLSPPHSSEITPI